LREEPSVREFQVIQETLDRIVVKIVPGPGFSDATRQVIASRLAQRCEGGVAIEVERVQSLERLPSGKHRYVISKVADAYLDSFLRAK